ncbi:SAM-dependent methyltransferase [Roseomonas mucosa]|uniref:SAM-dependent methyltransferase n=1 Tax=Roseomonas mucosa TaxID=207340 RepID=A0A4Y1MTY8_9PROT|nr:methyltransferase domain-containing protein [Roseomonas mucosa]AWV21492.1 SAM-dependent methyltransferase [Roseomonas mucosa]MDT8277344.1 methyltransferase domain-containing protein [Roseomonas mucosa]MDT8356474.1 methyltransferase domain-containing protein [Roseomonas mucosa]MDU7523884.1 methyltransferase domain-containing protein [Roseomonas mucosa]
MEDWRALNLANWEERTAVHLGPGGYDLSSHRAGRGKLDAIVEAELGPVAGQRVLHLQCHIGDDSIALAQRGASEVVGVDFSTAAISAAAGIARECGVANARFVEADVYAAPQVLAAEAVSFDLVFTSWGTITWLPDVEAWARVVAHFLRPGGSLYFADLHPVAAVFDGLADATDAEGRPSWLIPYFDRTSQVFDDPLDYADPSARLVNSRTVNWVHPLADMLGALRSAGLRLDWLREHARLTWQMFPALLRDADGLWTWPGRPWLPLALSLRALRD